MASVHPKIFIIFNKDGKSQHLQILWDIHEKMTHISDIRKIIHTNLSIFGIPKNTPISDIILKK
jgi:hypothetical protein